MMIRSIPPASSHLADSPVPAPPPTIGTCLATMSRNFSSIFFLSMAGMASDSFFLFQDVPEVLHQCGGELRVVDMQGQPRQAARRGLLQCFLDRIEYGRVGFGSVKRHSGRIQRG